MSNQLKNMMIGFFIVIACALIVGMILFIEPSVGDGKQTIIARFTNVNGISVGTRVLFAGKAVGEVTSIEPIPHARQQPIDHAGNVFIYQLILSIDSSVHVYNTDEITVQTSGLLGEKSIAIIPKSPPKGIKPKLLTAKTPVYAVSTDPLESAFNELSELSEKVDEALEQIMTWFGQNSESLTFAVASFGKAMDQIATTMEHVNETDIVRNVDDSAKYLSSILDNVDQGVEELRKNSFFPNLAISMQNIKSFSHSINIAAIDIAKGTGTIGKLITSDDMYLRVNALMSKVDTLLNDVNHYGLLFNYNKQWQRTRQQQMNLLNSLKTPNNFRNYFEDQVSTINSAMMRLSLMIEKAQTEPSKESIFANEKFHDDFAQLLKRVDELADNLKLYNQQLMELSTQESCNE